MILDPVRLLKELVRIDTVNPPGGEMRIVRRLAEILEEAGVACTVQEPVPGRGNIIALLPAENPAEKPLFLLSHLDVVPADGDGWQYPPFEAQEHDGYIYGRGTVDTKQLTVMELAAFLALKQRGTALRRDVFFLATCDEEAGSRYGMRWFLEHEIEIDGRVKTGADWIAGSDVISEGGGFPVVACGKEYYLCESGQKSCGTVEFTVKARKAKGPYFASGDGMARAMALACDIGRTEMEGAALETVRRFESRLNGARLSPMMAKILDAMKRNTMTVTMIAGKNVNTVTVTCDVRLLPGFGRDYLQRVLDSLCEKWDCEARILDLSDGYESSPDSGFLTILENATLAELGKTRQEAEILPFVSMGSSDGRYLTRTGARVYGYSPVFGWDMTFDSAVKMVHGVNERIHRDSVVFGSRVLSRAVLAAAGEEKEA